MFENPTFAKQGLQRGGWVVSDARVQKKHERHLILLWATSVFQPLYLVQVVLGCG
jgi:hypothetical protein